jgi:hypothetical protein
MGLTINEFPVYDNLASIKSVYLNIRDIKLNKVEDGYEISFWFNIKKDNKYILAEQIVRTQSTPHINDCWKEAYDIVKNYLSEKNLVYTDEI